MHAYTHIDIACMSYIQIMNNKKNLMKIRNICVFIVGIHKHENGDNKNI